MHVHVKRQGGEGDWIHGVAMTGGLAGMSMVWREGVDHCWYKLMQIELSTSAVFY